MKVKVRKRKSPAPVSAKQVEFRSTIEILRELIPEYGIPKTSWFELFNKERQEFLTHDIKGNRRNLKTDNSIPEPEFIAMIDKIHHNIHNPRIKNGRIKHFPDLKISELAKMFSI